MILETGLSNKEKACTINKNSDFRLPQSTVVNIELCKVQEIIELFKTERKNMAELTQSPVELGTNLNGFNSLNQIF